MLTPATPVRSGAAEVFVDPEQFGFVVAQVVVDLGADRLMPALARRFEPVKAGHQFVTGAAPPLDGAWPLCRRLVFPTLLFGFLGLLARLRQPVERAFDAGDHAGGDARVARRRI